jgi:hypothetical protein
MVTRLSGGLTPADGADPRTFPAIWNATANTIEAAQASIVSQGNAITAVEGSAVALGSAVDNLKSGDVAHDSFGSDTIALDFTSNSAVFSRQVSGTAVAITGSNYFAGATKTVRLFGGTAVASLSVPVDWVFVGTAAGTSIGTATTVVISATAFGTAATDVVAAYAEEA